MATLSGFGYDAGVEVSIRGKIMAISEDTAAIVAATLTASMLAGKKELTPGHYVQVYRQIKQTVSEEPGGKMQKVPLGGA